MPPHKKKKKTQSRRCTTNDSTVFGGSPMATSSPVSNTFLPNSPDITMEELISLRDAQLQSIDRHFNTLKWNFLNAVNAYKSITSETKDNIFCDVNILSNHSLRDYVEDVLAQVLSGKSESLGQTATSGNEKNDADVLQNVKDSTSVLPPRASATVIKKKRQSRSVEPNRNRTETKLKRSQSGESRGKSSRNNFQTPANKLKGSSYYVASVTPGPNVNAPTAIYRHPNPDEVVISLSGSPILVSSSGQRSTTPQINIPLDDGRVLAVLAKEGLTAASLPKVDPDTLKQLKLLQNFLKENI